MTLLSRTLAAWPLVARAQQPGMPVIGFMHTACADRFLHLVAALQSRLHERAQHRQLASHRSADGVAFRPELRKRPSILLLRMPATLE
jgi:hypothetical protein